MKYLPLTVDVGNLHGVSAPLLSWPNGASEPCNAWLQLDMRMRHVRALVGGEPGAHAAAEIINISVSPLVCGESLAKCLGEPWAKAALRGLCDLAVHGRQEEALQKLRADIERRIAKDVELIPDPLSDSRVLARQDRERERRAKRGRHTQATTEPERQSMVGRRPARQNGE